MGSAFWKEAVLLAIASLTCVAAMVIMARGRWRTRRGYVLLAWFLPLGQLVVLALLIHALIQRTDALWPCLVILATNAACAAGDVALLRGVDLSFEKQRVEEEASLLEEQVRLQTEYYESMAEQHARAERMRTAFGERLKQVRLAIERLDAEGARSAVQVAGSALRPEGVPWCRHPVVDALLWNKSQEFERLGIAFTCSVDLPEEARVEDVVLCAAFSNMLDNAGRACADLPAGQRWVNLWAFARGGQFALRVENPHRGGPRRSKGSGLSRHGWGLEILRLIAEDYGGDLTLSDEGGVFRTQLVLYTRRLAEKPRP